MAEGWARHLKGEIIEPYSAGIEKHGLNPLAVRVMAEAGIDISTQQSKVIDELPAISFDYVVTLCDSAHETCPYFPGRIIHRGFPDPPQLAKEASSDEEILQAYRSVRDCIRDFVVALPGSLNNWI